MLCSPFVFPSNRNTSTPILRRPECFRHMLKPPRRPSAICRVVYPQQWPSPESVKLPPSARSPSDRRAAGGSRPSSAQARRENRVPCTAATRRAHRGIAVPNTVLTPHIEALCMVANRAHPPGRSARELTAVGNQAGRTTFPHPHAQQDDWVQSGGAPDGLRTGPLAAAASRPVEARPYACMFRTMAAANSLVFTWVAPSICRCKS